MEDIIQRVLERQVTKTKSCTGEVVMAHEARKVVDRWELRSLERTVVDRHEARVAKTAVWVAGPIENGRMNEKIKGDDTWSIEDVIGTMVQRWGLRNVAWGSQDPKMPTVKTPKGYEYGIKRVDRKPLSKSDLKAMDKKFKL